MDGGGAGQRDSRLDREEGLGIRGKRRMKRVAGPRALQPPARRSCGRRSVAFPTDGLADGRRFRVLTRVENVSRVSPAIAVGALLSGQRVGDVLDEAIRRCGAPGRICVDNGPEFTSKALEA